VGKTREQEVWGWFTEQLMDINLAPIHPGYANTYGYFYGACLGLQEAITHLYKSSPDLGRDGLKLLPCDNFETIIGLDGHVRWKRTPRARMYACEYYLNKAQGNIAACVDTILNQWMIDRLPGPYGGDQQRVSYDLLYLYIISRLGIVSAIRNAQVKLGARIPHSPVFELLERDWNRPSNLFHTETAAKVIAQNVTIANGILTQTKEFPLTVDSLLPPEGLEQLHLSYTDLAGNRTPLSIVDCLMIVCARVNAFKHFPSGLSDRAGDYHVAEWMITCRALECTRILFRDKIASVPEGPTTHGV
jgi:hypothetical protein